MSGVSLTAAQKASLLSLQRTTELANRAQNNLSTGRRVNDVNDNPVAFFLARSLSESAAQFAQRREEIDQGISAVRTSLAATDTIGDFTRQLRGIAEAARSTTDEGELNRLTQQFEQVGRQISEVARDASFNGVNLLASDNNDLTIQVGVNEGAELTVQANNLVSETASAGSLFNADAFTSEGDIRLDQLGLTGGSFVSLLSNPAEINGLIRNIDEAIERLRSRTQELGANISTLQTRASFNDAAANELQAGADALTLADLNEEAALTLAARTRQQLGVQSLAISGGQQQALLRLVEGSV